MNIRNAALSVILAASLVPVTAKAQTVTGLKTEEVTSGMTKQCIYDALGSQYTRTISSVALCPLSIQVPTPGSSSIYSAPAPSRQSGGLAFKTGENVTGMTKQCYYNYLGSTKTLTISSVSLCPLTVQVGN